MSYRAILSSVLLLSAATVGWGPTHAAERKLAVSATVRALASDDIFLTNRESSTLLGEGMGRLQWSQRDERHSLAADLSMGARGYSSKDIEGETFGIARLSGTRAITERLSTSGDLLIARERTAELANEVAAAVDPRRQVTSIQGSLRLSWKRNEQVTVVPLLDIRRQSFKQAGVGGGAAALGLPLRSFSSFGTGLGFNRALSERLTVGVSSRIMVDRFDGGGVSVRVSGGGQATLALSETLKASGALGVDHSLHRADGTQGSTGLTGNASLCQTWLHRNGCVRVASTRDASGLGSGERIEAGATYSWQIARNTALSADSAFTSTSFGERKLSFITANVNASHRIGEHLSLGLTAGYRRRAGLVRADGAIIGLNLSWTTEAVPS